MVQGGGLLHELCLYSICPSAVWKTWTFSQSHSPCGRTQLLRPSVQMQTENRGMEGEQERWGGHRGAIGSVESERRPFDMRDSF